MSRSRLRIRRNILDPIHLIVSNNGGGNRKNLKLKKVVPDTASDCSSVTDITEDNIVPLNTCVKNLSLPDNICDNIPAKNCHDSIGSNNIHNERKFCFSPKNASRIISINHHPFFTSTGFFSGKEKIFMNIVSLVLYKPQFQLQYHEDVYR